MAVNARAARWRPGNYKCPERSLADIRSQIVVSVQDEAGRRSYIVYLSAVRIANEHDRLDVFRVEPAVKVMLGLSTL